MNMHSVNPFKPYSALLVTSYRALIKVTSLLAEAGSGVDMQMVAARLGCQSIMVGTRCMGHCCPGCMDKFRKCYSHKNVACRNFYIP